MGHHAQRPADKIVEQHAELKAVGGNLRATGDLETSLAFYRDEYVLATDPDGGLTRSDFLRGPDGKVAWLRDGEAVGEAGVSRGSPPRPTRKLSTGKDLSACAPPIRVSGPLSIVLKLMLNDPKGHALPSCQATTSTTAARRRSLF